MLGLLWCLEKPVTHAKYVWIILNAIIYVCNRLKNNELWWILMGNSAHGSQAEWCCRSKIMRYLQDDWSQELGGAFRAHAVRPKTATWQARDLCAVFAAICCPNLFRQFDQIFKICFPLMFGHQFSTAFSLFGQGSAEHRWLHWCTASATDAISFLHACCTP